MPAGVAVVRKRYRGPGMQRAQEGTWVGLVSKSLTLPPAPPRQVRPGKSFDDFPPTKKNQLMIT